MSHFESWSVLLCTYFLLSQDWESCFQLENLDALGGVDLDAAFLVGGSRPPGQSGGPIVISDDDEPNNFRFGEF